jgi:alcohol dehydrogenase (cytochrome c)
VKQTWAKGLDERGRPIRLPNTDPTLEGNLIYPGSDGATNWYSPSYNPNTRLFYVATQQDYGQIFYKRKADNRPGHVGESEGGNPQYLPGVEWPGAIRALELETGKLRWIFTLHSAASSGVLSTAGGVVFGSGHEGYFFGLDAESGEALWHFQAGGNISANPITFLIDGKQYVAIAAGQSFFVFAN